MRPRFSVRRARARRTRNGRVREQRARAPRNLVEVVVAELLLGVRGARFRRLEGRTDWPASRLLAYALGR